MFRDRVNYTDMGVDVTSNNGLDDSTMTDELLTAARMKGLERREREKEI